MEIKAVIFDMDGLMFDTESLWFSDEILTYIKEKYHITADMMKKAIGVNSKTTEKILKEELGYDFSYESFYRDCYQIIDNIIKKEGLGIKKGLIELLSFLKENGYKIAIASSSKVERIHSCLEKTNINPNTFDVIMSGEHVINGKPNPEIFIKTAQKLNVKADNTLILEDSNNGIKSAFDSGSIPILIPDIDIIRDETEKMAYKKLNNLLEVIDLLKNH